MSAWKTLSTVLVVEDDPSSLEILATVLSSNYAVLKASTLREAREFVSNQWVDVVILDLNLPDGRGDDFLSSLQDSVTQVVVLTETRDLERATELMSKGVFYYLTKDAHSERILRMVSQASLKAIELTRQISLQDRLDRVSREIQLLRNSLGASGNESPVTLTEAVEAFEREFLYHKLEKQNWNRTATAKSLGIHLNTLLLKMKRYEIAAERGNGERERLDSYR